MINHCTAVRALKCADQTIRSGMRERLAYKTLKFEAAFVLCFPFGLLQASGISSDCDKIRFRLHFLCSGPPFAFKALKQQWKHKKESFPPPFSHAFAGSQFIRIRN